MFTTRAVELLNLKLALAAFASGLMSSKRASKGLPRKVRDKAELSSPSGFPQERIGAHPLEYLRVE